MKELAKTEHAAGAIRAVHVDFNSQSGKSRNTSFRLWRSGVETADSKVLDLKIQLSNLLFNNGTHGFGRADSTHIEQ